jgi:hypothetical protein
VKGCLRDFSAVVLA